MRKEILLSIGGAILIILISITLLPTLGTIFFKQAPETQLGATTSVRLRNLELTMRLNKTNYNIGETLRAIIRLKNIGPNTVTLTFLTSKKFDFKITDAAGVEVFKWSSRHVFLQVLITITLNPEEAIEQELTWTINIAKAGTYGITASSSFILGYPEKGSLIFIETPKIMLKINP